MGERPEGRRPLGRPRRRWDLYLYSKYQGDQIKNNEIDGASSTYGGRGAYRFLVERPEGRRPLGRPRRRWDLYFSSNIIRVIKSRRMRWAGHIARMGERCIQDFGGET
jgi:hypothetical protein